MSQEDQLQTPSQSTINHQLVQQSLLEQQQEGGDQDQPVIFNGTTNNQQDNSSDEQDDLGQIYCGIQAKKDIKCINIFYIFIIQVVGISMLMLKIVFGLPLLKSPDYFGMMNEEGTALISFANSLTFMPKIITVFCVGLIFDLLGRRIALTTILLVFGLTTAWLPFTSPDKSLFVLAMVVNATAFTLLEAHPLLLDYPAKNSQGKVIALSSLGMQMGILLGNGVLVTAFKNSDFMITFTIGGAIVIAFALLTPFMVIEPPDLQKKQKKIQDQKENVLEVSNHESTCSSLKYILNLNYLAYRSNHKLIILQFLSVMGASVQVCIILTFINPWIFSFERDAEHPNNLLSYDSCIYYIQYHGLSGCILSIFTTMHIGKIADKFEPKIILPLVFLISALASIALGFSTPSFWSFAIAAPLFHISMNIKMIVVKTNCYKMYPIEIRATLIGNVLVVAALMDTLVTVMFNVGFQRFGSNAPMIMCGLIDLVIVVLIFLFSKSGLVPTLKDYEDLTEVPNIIEDSQDASDSKFERV